MQETTLWRQLLGVEKTTVVEQVEYDADEGIVICGGLPAAEMPQLTAAVPFSEAEQELLIGWQDPPAWDPSTGREAEPPGRGKFLVKVGGRPGIPVNVQLTATELSINDTNKLWHEQSRVGRRALRAVEGAST